MNVLMPDGTTVTGVPDGITQDELLRMYSGKESTLSDSLKSLAYAPAKAVTGFAGFGGDIADLAKAGREKLGSYLPEWAQNADKITNMASPVSALSNLLPRSRPIRSGIEQVTGPWHDPQTRTGKVVDTAAQAATTFGRSLVTRPTQALPVIAGITGGTETAGALTDDNPWARLLGGLVGGGVPAAAQAARSRPGVILKDALGSQTPDQISAATAMQQQAAQRGVPLMGTESFDAGHQLASAVLAHPNGNKILEQFLKQRPGQVDAAVRGGLLDQTGAIGTPASNAARAQQAATDVISNAERARSAAVSPLYQQAAGEVLPNQALRPVANELQSMLLQAPIASASEKALGGWHKQLFPYEPAPVVAETASKARKVSPVTVNPNQDDIITAIRKLGGITPKDESIGSLAKLMPFAPDPRFGPVWRQSEYRSSTGSNTSAGHSPDRMAELLYEKGYLDSRDNLPGLMSKIEDHAMGAREHFSLYRQQEAADPLTGAIDRLVRQMEVKNLPRNQKPADITPQAALPETNVGRLNEIYKTLGIERDLPSIGATAEQKIASFPAGKLQDVLGDVLKRESPTTAKAQALYADITRREVDPLKAGPVGLVAGKTGVDPAAASPVPRIVSAISDSATARPETIRALYEPLNKVDKDAFPGIVQTHLENQLNAATERLRSGPNPTAGAKFAQAIAGTPQERANFEEMMRGVARARGGNPDAVVAGAGKLLDVLERTGRTPGIGSQTQGRGEIGKEMGKTLIGDTLSTISLTPTKPLARRLEDWIQRGRYEEMAKALTAPNSVEILSKMAKLDPRSVTAEFYAATLLGLDRAIGSGQ